MALGLGSHFTEVSASICFRSALISPTHSANNTDSGSCRLLVTAMKIKTFNFSPYIIMNIN